MKLVYLHIVRPDRQIKDHRGALKVFIRCSEYLLSRKCPLYSQLSLFSHFPASFYFSSLSIKATSVARKNNGTTAAVSRVHPMERFYRNGVTLKGGTDWKFLKLETKRRRWRRRRRLTARPAEGGNGVKAGTGAA